MSPSICTILAVIGPVTASLKKRTLGAAAAAVVLSGAGEQDAIQAVDRSQVECFMWTMLTVFRESGM